MDKLTWYDNDGRIMCRRGYEVALARLASYEATGLTPEQVVKAKTIIESAFADDTSKAERIRKLMAADDEGRVVMLPPCKYGDTLYCLENGKIYPKTITLIAFLPPRYTSHHNHIRKKLPGRDEWLFGKRAWQNHVSQLRRSRAGFGGTEKCLSRKSWVCQPPTPRMPELISCAARKRQNVGNGLSQAMIGWNVWNRNVWNVKRRL